MEVWPSGAEPLVVVSRWSWKSVKAKAKDLHIKDRAKVKDIQRKLYSLWDVPTAYGNLCAIFSKECDQLTLTQRHLMQFYMKMML